MNGTKPAILSIGMISGAIGVLVVILNMFGISITAEEQGQLADAINVTADKIIVLVTLIGTIYGRYRASSRISGVIKTKEAA